MDEHMTAEADSELVDRLSELPDSLILEILSLLPMRDVVQTTLLSKRWEDLWKTIPCLDFRYTEENDLDSFKSFINRAVALWRGAKIRKISLSYMLDSLLQFAIKKQVEEINIDISKKYSFYLEYEEGDFCAPRCLYSYSSITKLSLAPFELHMVKSVRWNQLKSLTIQRAEFAIEDAMSHILSGSPSLEVLNLSYEENGRHMIIESSSLKMLMIDVYEVHCSDSVSKGAMLRIWAPNLESLELYGVSYSMCLLDAPSLSSAVLGFDERNWFMLLGEMLQQLFLSICYVERLTLTDWCIKFLLEMKKKDMVITFSDAKFLKLYPGEADGISDVLEFFPELRKLVIQHNEISSLFRDEEELCIAPTVVLLNHSFLHLKTVEITWHLRDASIIPVIKFLLENAPVLEKMVLRLRTHGADPEMLDMAEEKMLSMPRSSPNVKVIIIHVC